MILLISKEIPHYLIHSYGNLKILNYLDSYNASCYNIKSRKKKVNLGAVSAHRFPWIGNWHALNLQSQHSTLPYLLGLNTLNLNISL